VRTAEPKQVLSSLTYNQNVLEHLVRHSSKNVVCTFRKGTEQLLIVSRLSSEAAYDSAVDAHAAPHYVQILTYCAQGAWALHFHCHFLPCGTHASIVDLCQRCCCNGLC
jgi:hypothetical protein